MFTRPPAPTPAQRETLATGLGFSLGFGWLWFPALQGFWLPEFLWGGIFDGGGASLFCALLLAGLFGVGALGGGLRFLQRARLFQAGKSGKAPAGANDAAGTDDFRASRLLHWAHAATLALMGASLLPPAPISGARLYLPVICMALAALLQGLFWGGAVLALPPRLAAASLVIAAVVAALFGGFVSAGLPGSGLERSIALLLAVLAAWKAACDLARGLRLPRPEPRRPRGRPAKNAGPESEDGPESGYAANGRPALYAAGAAVALLALAAGLAQRAFFPPAFFDSPFATGSFVALGAALGLVPRGNGLSADNGAQASPASGPAGPGPFFARPFLPPAPAICLALGLCGIALALPEPLASPLAVFAPHAAEGFVGVAAACVLAGPFSLPPLRRAALALGAACVLSNLGSAAAGIPARLSASTDMPALCRMAGVVIVGAALLLFAASRRRTRETERPDAGPVREIPPVPAEPEPAAVTFTAREREILGLIRQGLNNRKIAEILRVQDVTVRFHLRNLYQKTGRNEREELAALDAAAGADQDGLHPTDCKKRS